MDKLAIHGGIPIRQGLLPKQITIGEEEKRAVAEVFRGGLLSGFRGNSSPSFYGGEYIKRAEEDFKRYFKTEYAYTCNSCTSALQIACGAIGLEPGDEVIVTPYSMSCSATAPMVWGATPVFADVEPEYFCLDPKSIEEKITDKTKAIIVVDLFGQPYDVEEINRIATKHNLYIIEDAAQAIGSVYEDRFSGALGHIGCFSFTQGKHLTAGEGGMAITNDPALARNFSLIRNHAEAVISDLDYLESVTYRNMVGYNMRMTEIQAAIVSEQLKKLDYFVRRRRENVHILNSALNEIPFLKSAAIRKRSTHSYYVQALLYDKEKAQGVHRDTFVEAVKAELKPEEGRIDKGVPIGNGYIKPLYRMPLFQDNHSWTIRNIDYKQTFLPVVEELWREKLIVTTIPGLDLNEEDRNDIISAFYKVAQNIESLKE